MGRSMRRAAHALAIKHVEGSRLLFDGCYLFKSYNNIAHVLFLIVISQPFDLKITALQPFYPAPLDYLNGINLKQY